MVGIEVDAALRAQSAEISSAREDAQRQMDALSVHLGELQARLVRLDALGERLTELADVDPDEFDFSLSVGQGGVDEPLEAAPMPRRRSWRRWTNWRHAWIPASSSSRCWSNCSPTSTSASRPTWPASRCAQGYISSPFGRRVNPVSGRLSMHKGIDFAAPAGSDVVAVAARGGDLVRAQERLWQRGPGRARRWLHHTLYAHNQKNLVEVGDLVKRGSAGQGRQHRTLHRLPRTFRSDEGWPGNESAKLHRTRVCFRVSDAH